MTFSAPLRTLAAKEARALLPLWAACFLAGLAAPVIHGAFHDFSVIAFGGGIVALGAYSVGHEYVHRTLGTMLTMPADRRELFAVKLAVLTALVVPLAVYASLRHLCAPEVPPWLIAGGALCLAPALTMVCRNTLGGTLLSVSLATTLLALVMLIVAGPWDAAPGLARAAFTIWSRLMIVVFAGGALLAWQLCKRLEWIESSVEIALPWQAAAALRTTAPTRPLWQLLNKELRLQRLAFAVAALYVVASVAEAALRLVRPYDVPFLAPAAAGYWLCVPVLAGSVASADERQLGTLSSQVLLPVPAWQQWAAKAGTVFGLALILGIAVPFLMLGLLGVDDSLVRTLPALPAAVILTFALSAGGLYVSSLSRTGVAAAVASFGAIVVCLWIAELFVPGAMRVLLQRPLVITRETGGALAALAAAAVLLLRRAFVNHQSV